MTTTDVMSGEDYEPTTEPDEAPADDWHPLVLDPVRQRLVELGGARIAEVLSASSPTPLPPLSTSYGFFSRICGETDEALTIWFQPAGDVPAVRLVVADPFSEGWALTEELVLPTAKRHLVVLAPLAEPHPAWLRAHAQLLAICTTPIEDLGIGADVVSATPLGKISIRESVIEL